MDDPRFEARGYQQGCGVGGECCLNNSPVEYEIQEKTAVFAAQKMS
jgi:hypothetical protein